MYTRIWPKFLVSVSVYEYIYFLHYIRVAAHYKFELPTDIYNVYTYMFIHFMVSYEESSNWLGREYIYLYSGENGLT